MRATVSPGPFYTFIWAMAGDNVDYKDVEMVAMGDLR